MLPYLSGLPHLPGVPHLHVNRPLEIAVHDDIALFRCPEDSTILVTSSLENVRKCE